MNYTELRQNIIDYTENDATEFTDKIDTIIKLAEKRISLESNLLIFRQKITTAIVSGQAYITVPTGLVETRWIRVVGGKPLRQKDEAFIYEFSATAATPRFYSWGSSNRTRFLLAPTPNSSGTLEIGYTYVPETIVTATNTWLGDNEESVLLFACLVESVMFMKSEPEEKTAWVEMYQRALSALTNQDEGDALTDAFTKGD